MAPLPGPGGHDDADSLHHEESRSEFREGEVALAALLFLAASAECGLAGGGGNNGNDALPAATAATVTSSAEGAKRKKRVGACGQTLGVG